MTAVRTAPQRWISDLTTEQIIADIAKQKEILSHAPAKRDRRRCTDMPWALAEGIIAHAEAELKRRGYAKGNR